MSRGHDYIIGTKHLGCKPISAVLRDPSSLASGKPTIFLSSTFAPDIVKGQQINPLTLRRRFIEEAEPDVNVWAYEKMYPEPELLPGPQILERCTEGIEACDLFVFLETGRHGSGVAFGPEHAALVSYLETELFFAAVLRKPIAVLVLRGTEPDPKLKEVLGILRHAMPVEAMLVDDENQLLERWKSLAAELRRKHRWRFPTLTKLARLVDWFSFNRTRDDLDEDIANPKLKFLDGWGLPAIEAPTLRSCRPCWTKSRRDKTPTKKACHMQRV